MLTFQALLLDIDQLAIEYRKFSLLKNELFCSTVWHLILVELNERLKVYSAGEESLNQIYCLQIAGKNKFILYIL